jgi:hypothetical protein
LGAASVLIGCQSVGPLAIDAGRDRYNNIIQSTSKEQTLSNIVRVLNHEPTSFMDVSEVDATTTFSANTSGGLSGIGAIAGIHSASAGTIAGEVGNVSGGVSYSEAPVIRYTPLLGQSLVAQLVTPISVDALEYLTESNWPPSPVFDLASSYLTPDLSEFYPALNILSELYDQGSLSFVAAPSDLSKRESEGASAQTKKTSSGTLTLQVANKPEGGKDDALDVYLLPLHRHVRDPGFVEGKRTLQLWVRLLWIYSGSQPKFAPPKDAKCAQLSVSTDPVALRRWDMRLGSGEQGFDLDGIRKCLPNFIELRTMPATASKAVESGLSSGAPLLKTYSALGVLKNATERPHPRFAVVDRSRYEAIRSHDWNKDQDSLGFYTLLPEDENFGDEPPPAKGKENEAAKTEQEAIASIERAGANVFVYDPPSASQEDFVKVNQRLGFLRRYILIVQSDRPPPANAYASHFADGAWFYIDGEDQVSQKNFDLVSLFLTMMAIPSAVPPIAPTIPVGG